MILQLLSLCYASYNPEQLTVFRSHLIKKWNMDKRRGETLCPKKTTDMWQKVQKMRPLLPCFWSICQTVFDTIRMLFFSRKQERLAELMKQWE